MAANYPIGKCSSHCSTVLRQLVDSKRPDVLYSLYRALISMPAITTIPVFLCTRPSSVTSSRADQRSHLLSSVFSDISLVLSPLLPRFILTSSLSLFYSSSISLFYLSLLHLLTIAISQSRSPAGPDPIIDNNVFDTVCCDISSIIQFYLFLLRLCELESIGGWRLNPSSNSPRRLILTRHGIIIATSSLHCNILCAVSWAGELYRILRDSVTPHPFRRILPEPRPFRCATGNWNYLDFDSGTSIMTSIPPIRTNIDNYEAHEHLHDEDPIEDDEYEEGSEIDPAERERLAHHRMVDEFLSPLSLDEAVLYQLARRFSTVYRHLASTSEQQFLPTPVTRLPNGNETGRYLAIDVGGSNLRVAFIELLGEAADADIRSTDASERSRDTIRKAQRQRVRRTLERAWPIQEHLKLDKAEDLFSWIGDCIAEVVAESLSSDTMRGGVPQELDMGITFSFPIMQESLAEATLMPMGKGFAITSDLNLRKILLNGYEKHTRRLDEDDEPSSKRRKLFSLPRLKIAAITNDTVATLASLAYAVKSLPNSRVAMGIIVGTGCNATIPMKLSALHESKAKHVRSTSPKAEETIINTEWTISGAASPLKELDIITKWDTDLDRECARPGFQPFEYMTGGRYIGELIRLILYDYITNFAGISEGDLPTTLLQAYALTTTYISNNVARSRSDPDLANELNHSMAPPENSQWSWDATTAGIFRKIARTVQRRSAGLIAAAVVGLLACAREIELKVDSKENSPQNSQAATPEYNGNARLPSKLGEGSKVQGPIVPVLTPTPADWQSGPEELVVAYTGGIIQNYPNFKESCQQYIDRLIMRTGPQKSGKSVFLREASDGGVIGAGVLAGMVVDS